MTPRKPVPPSPNHPTVDLPAYLEGPRLPTTYLPAVNDPNSIRAQRDALIRLAGQYEIPPATIARALGLTETRVRQILKAPQ